MSLNEVRQSGYLGNGKKLLGKRSRSTKRGRIFPALALLLLAVTPPIWGVAGLAAGLSFFVRGALMICIAAPLGLILAPFLLACRSWSNWDWSWLCRQGWFLEPSSWLCGCWLRWPWLCWSWLR